jgi:hypothetical protein
MPTGYTCIIEDNANTTLRDYALRCARAFGACVMQRDESLDSPPRPREVSGHYAEQIARAQSRLVELKGISAASARALWEADCESKRRANAREAAEHARKSGVYAVMRAEVEAWAPPTADHGTLRTFMLEQIDLCYRPGEEPYIVALPPSPESYIEGQRQSAIRDLDYYTEGRAEEIERMKQANAWLDALLSALPEASPR